MRAYSYSKLRQFKDCPLAYQFRYILKVPSLPSLLLESGRLAHAAVQAYTEHLAKSKLKTDLLAVSAIVETLNITDEVLLAETTELLSKFVLSYIHNANTFHHSELKLAINQDWQKVNWFDKSVFFRGVLDRINIEENRVLITDYKSGWSTTEDRDQLLTYAVLIHSLFPDRDTFEVCNHFLRFKFSKSSPVSLAEIEHHKKKLLGQIQRIEGTKEFPAKPGYHCSYCGYLSKCGQLAVFNGLNLPVEMDKARAADLAGKTLFVEARLKQVKEMLKEWCNEHGPLQVDGGTYGFQVREIKKVEDVAAFCSVLWEKGEDPFPYLSVDMRKAKKLKLDELVSAEKMTSFGFKKGKG